MRKLISRDEAVDAAGQHTTPCSDCPWRRDSLRGWLGGGTAEEFLQYAHSNTQYDCHTVRGAQCAGMAVYRRNVCKRVEPPLLTLSKDTDTVFDTPMAFAAHHNLYQPKGN